MGLIGRMGASSAYRSGATSGGSSAGGQKSGSKGSGVSSDGVGDLAKGAALILLGPALGVPVSKAKFKGAEAVGGLLSLVGLIGGAVFIFRGARASVKKESK